MSVVINATKNNLGKIDLNEQYKSSRCSQDSIHSNRYESILFAISDKPYCNGFYPSSLAMVHNLWPSLKVLRSFQAH